jgi:hypothetical protein
VTLPSSRQSLILLAASAKKHPLERQGNSWQPQVRGRLFVTLAKQMIPAILIVSTPYLKNSEYIRVPVNPDKQPHFHSLLALVNQP